MINAQLPAWLNMSGAQMMGEYENLNMMRARRRALAQQMQMAQQQLDQQTKERQDYNQSVQSLQADMNSLYGRSGSTTQLPSAAQAQFDYLLGG
jgi:DNA repair exonuclease SbcCD ATPase subunit